MTTHLLATPDVDLAYDVYGPLPTTDGRPPLFMIAQPMTAEGFDALRGHFPDRTVVTYDPRGLGRSTRKDGRVDHTPTDQAADPPPRVQLLDRRRECQDGLDARAIQVAGGQREQRCRTVGTRDPAVHAVEYAVALALGQFDDPRALVRCLAEYLYRHFLLAGVESGKA